MRTMKTWSAVFAVLVGTLLSAQPAWAGCPQGTTVNSYAVEITPDTECLDISLSGSQCGDTVEVLLQNNCDASYVPAEDGWQCEAEPCNETDRFEVIDVPPGGSALIRDYEVASDTETTVSYQGTLDGQPLEVAVTYNASVSEYRGACSQAAGQPSASWIAIVLGLLSLGYLNRRERAEAAE